MNENKQSKEDLERAIKARLAEIGRLYFESDFGETSTLLITYEVDEVTLNKLSKSVIYQVTKKVTKQLKLPL